MYHIDGKFHIEKISPFSPPVLIDKILSHEFLSHVTDNLEPMAIFTVWAKIYSAKYFCNAGVGGLGEIFFGKIVAVWYAHANMDTLFLLMY